MKHEFIPRKICPTKIEFELDGDIVKNIKFTGGCNGNLKAISKLTEGMTVDRVEELFSGNTCGPKSTSCVDQLAKAVREAYDEEQAGKQEE